MATRKINEKMEFFYNGEDGFERMIEELNNRFSYQKVIFITNDQMIENMIFEKRKLFKFFSMVKNSLNHIEQDVCCVVQMNGDDILKNRELCYKNNTFFVLCITSYIDISLFDDKIVCDDSNVVVSPILGVFVLTENIKKVFDDFKFSLYLNMIEMCFYAIENKLDSLYFSMENNQFDIFISKFRDFFEKNNEKTHNEQSVLDFYFDMILLKRELNCNLLDCFSSFNNELENMFYKSVASEVLLNIYQIFTKKISPSIASVMNSNNLVYYENYISFCNDFDEQKFWFVTSKFKCEILNDIDNILNVICSLKKMIQKTNIDAIYFLSKNTNIDGIKNKLKTIALSLKQNSLLKIILKFGFLDFD